MTPRIVASIGATHPWNIAGVGLDAQVAFEYGLGHAMAIAAVTAQDAGGLHALHVIPPHAVLAQLKALPEDVAAFRIGALVSSHAVRVVAEFLRERAGERPIVIDPVYTVTLGGSLQADDALLHVLRSEMLTLPAIVTPNVLEAQTLLDMHIGDVEEARAAARSLVNLGARAALVKGGHLEGEPVDVLATPGEELLFAAPRLPGSMRGSGCTLAAALACELALGRALPAACENARRYVRDKIAARKMRGGLQVAF